MTDKFRVALSGDFRKADGSPTYPDFDLAPLHAAKGVEVVFLNSANPLRADQLEDFDALILLAHRFAAESVPKSGRLAVVARFGVGYDTVDVDACTQAGIALVITPDGVRRPVAVSIVTLMLALTGKLMIKDRLAREAAAGFAKRSDHMGVGLVGRTLGSVGIGNIGAELFRMAKPFDMRFIAHDPFADSTVAAELGIELVALDDVFRQADIVSVSCPLTAQTRHLVNAERLALMKPIRLPHQHGAGTDRRSKSADESLAGGPHRRRRAGRARTGTPGCRRSHSQARQRHPVAARAVLDGSMFCGKWRRRCQSRARRSARSKPARRRQSPGPRYGLMEGAAGYVRPALW